jgi:hypothetical protein
VRVFLPKGVELSGNEIEAWKSYVKLCSEKFYSLDPNLDKQFDLKLYKDLKSNFDCGIYATQMWQEHLDIIATELINQNTKLLQVDLIRYAIYLTTASVYAKSQIPFLKKNILNNDLKVLLEESCALQGTIIDEEFQTSESRVNHLTHLTIFELEIGVKIQSLETIMEFGGGYGGMTLLLRKMNPTATIVVIDFPEMITVQKYYIDTSLGDGHTNVKICDSDAIVEGAINYICIADLKNINFVNVSLLIATWSLSEANLATQELVSNKKLFNANHLLYGYRKYTEVNARQPCSMPMSEMLQMEQAREFPAFWATANEQMYLVY